MEESQCHICPFIGYISPSNIMDPYQSATTQWLGESPKTENDAYQLASQGYILSSGIGRLSLDELTDIASWRPRVDYEDYMQYREMSLDDFFSLFSGLDQLVPDISRYDAFYFATRRDLPYEGDLLQQLKRWDIYAQLQETTQKLFHRIYKEPENLSDHLRFAKTMWKHPLEDYLLDYDDSLYDRRRLRSLADRLGIFIPYIDQFNEDFNAQYLYDIFNLYLDLDGLPPRDLPPLDDVINMTEEQFKTTLSPYLVSISSHELSIEYHNRLHFVMKLYQRYI